jgi:N-acetyl-gamma-glutamyl-phosphate reductase
VASRSLAGAAVGGEFPDLETSDLRFVPSDPDSLVDQAVEVWILALGNGEAAPFAERLEMNGAKLVDISADFRCDPKWQYGLTEVFADQIASSVRVANPGCYATGVQLALWPVRKWLAATPLAFGVSGYSGAGRTPSPRNDPKRLADNVLPYQLAGHSHEVEVERHLGHRVRLLPHVAPFFRGIALTIEFQLEREMTLDELDDAYRIFFESHDLLDYSPHIPEIGQVRDTPRCAVGGLTQDPCDPTRWVIAAALDNLSKGAATQAIQNVNLMCGFEHHLGLCGD